MSLLNVTVKRAKYIGGQAAQLNTYVTLKLQNVKSTTVTVKGSEPCWEQDFLFETNNVNSGLLVEVWTKGMIWDRALGYQLIPLDTIPYSTTEDTQGQWYALDMDIILMDGEVAGTKNPTGHLILLDCRFELPFDPESHPGDLQRKLEILNGMMAHDRRHRQAQYLGNSGYSEDSDYTSDLNYPVGQNANSSASQYRNLRTPQRSLETSRENSYEKDDRSYYDHNMSSYSPTDYYYKDENDPLSYNSRPMSSINYSKNTSYGHQQQQQQQQLQNPMVLRKRSLERQDTLYDEYGDVMTTTTTTTGTAYLTDNNMYQNSDDPYAFYDGNSDNLSEDRQWDSGGRGTSMCKGLPKIPIKHSSSMVDGIYHRGASLPATPPVSHKKSRRLPQPSAGTTLSGTGISISVTKAQPTSLPATPRMLPQPKSSTGGGIGGGSGIGTGSFISMGGIGQILGGSSAISSTIGLKKNTMASDSDPVAYSQYSATNSILGDGAAVSISSISSTSSALPYTVRPHTSVSVINYNEDYNYAYHSTDSLNTTFNDSVQRRKGATLPSIPTPLSIGATSASISVNKIPKIGQINEYNSSSFDMDTRQKNYYNDSLSNDDYFYDTSITTSSILLPSLPMSTSMAATAAAAATTTTTTTTSRKMKKLPVPIVTSSSSQIYGITTTSMTTMSTSLLSQTSSSIGRSKLPQIPAATATTTITGYSDTISSPSTTIGWKPLSSTSYQQSSTFSDLHTTNSSISGLISTTNQQLSADYYKTELDMLAKNQTLSDMDNTSTNIGYGFPSTIASVGYTLGGNGYTSTPKDYEQYLYDTSNKYDTPTITDILTTPTSTYKTSNSLLNDSTTRPTSSMLSTITTGLKATVGGVVAGTVGGNANNNQSTSTQSSSSTTSTATSSLTNTAKSYLGLATKFLPNLTGVGSTTATSTVNPAATTTVTLTRASAFGCTSTTTTTATTTSSINNSKYGYTNDYSNYLDDNIQQQTTGYNYDNYDYTNTGITTSNSLFGQSTALTTADVLTSSSNDIYKLCNYSTDCYDDGGDNLNIDNDDYTDTSGTLRYSSQGYHYDDIPVSAPVTISSFGDNSYNYYGYGSKSTTIPSSSLDYFNSTLVTSTAAAATTSTNSGLSSTTAAGGSSGGYLSGIGTSSILGSITALSTTTTSTATTTTTTTTTGSSIIGNIVDYSDDYKYGYDDYSYSENDYIATGDITDKTNYNNNYDLYDTTTTAIAGNIGDYTLTSTLTTPLSSSNKNDILTSIYDYDYSNNINKYSDHNSQQQQQYNNKNSSVYCDNSYNFNTSVPSTISSASVTTYGGSGISSTSAIKTTASPSILTSNTATATTTSSSSISATSFVSSLLSTLAGVGGSINAGMNLTGTATAATTSATSGTTPMSTTTASMGYQMNNKTGQHSMHLDQNNSLANNQQIVTTSTINNINNANQYTTSIYHQQHNDDGIIDSMDNHGYYNNTNSNYMDQSMKYIPTTTSSTIIGTLSTTATTQSQSVGGKKLLPKMPINGKNNMLMKQQPTEIYDDDEDLPIHDIDDDDNLDNGDIIDEDDEIDDYYMNDMKSGTQQSTINDYYQQQSHNQKVYGSGANDTPYYDYREDYFNEEDEYKYLENEQEQQEQAQQHRHNQMHQKNQSSLEYIEESRDDYIDDDDDHHHLQHHHQQHQHHDMMMDNGHYLDIPTTTTTATTAAKVNSQQQQQLLSQETIDESSLSDYDQHNQQQQSLSLKKQESIIEEDEDEQIPSPNQLYQYDQKDIVQMTAASGISAMATSTAAAAAITSGVIATTQANAAKMLQAKIPSSLHDDLLVNESDQMPPTKQQAGIASSELDILASGDIEPIKKKILTRGETEEVTSGLGVRKPEITARQRWNWAYNKIIMQLNDSAGHQQKEQEACQEGGEERGDLSPVTFLPFHN